MQAKGELPDPVACEGELRCTDVLAAYQDQTIHSLKAILERQELIFDEKLKLVNAKYDQVKTINTALQVRLNAATLALSVPHQLVWM